MSPDFDRSSADCERIVYLNGEFLPDSSARVSIFDRGFLMSDGVYEVTSVADGKLLEYDDHMTRLSRSLAVLGMENPLNEHTWLEIHRDLMRRNRLTDGMIYVQVTRGSVGDREFEYPPAGTRQTVVLFTQSRPHASKNVQASTGVKVISLPDLRWGRRDVKTIQLLYSSMGKMEAKRRGADDAWFTDGEYVTEGTSNNAFIVKDKSIITRPLSNDILHGTTRASLLRFAAEENYRIEERPFTLKEALNADEAFFTSSVAYVVPVVEIDGRRLGTGKPGSVAKRLRSLYLERALKEAV
ncbi:D-amino-acid transaminase [Paucibacter sp. O1-1]|nr:D-amino-acid transaminase [Paucibacter sp. O1-1]MDA3825075.1 D-amino-acid transaminase [Paucibacter sp. O1-1]